MAEACRRCGPVRLVTETARPDCPRHASHAMTGVSKVKLPVGRPLLMAQCNHVTGTSAKLIRP